MGPSDSPWQPACPSPEFWLIYVSLIPPRGLPCCCSFHLLNMPSPIPRRNDRLHASLASPVMSAFPDPRRVSFRINVFGACSAFTARYGLLSRQATFMALSTRGFRRVVTFTTTPVATGRSEIAGRGLHPLGNCAFPRRTGNIHLIGSSSLSVAGYTGSKRARRSSGPARPYIVRLSAFRRLICPSVWPLLHGSVIAFLTASMSLCAVRAKRCIAYKPDFWASLSQAPSLLALLLLSRPLNRMASRRIVANSGQSFSSHRLLQLD